MVKDTTNISISTLTLIMQIHILFLRLQPFNLIANQPLYFHLHLVVIIKHLLLSVNPS